MGVMPWKEFVIAYSAELIQLRGAPDPVHNAPTPGDEGSGVPLLIAHTLYTGIWPHLNPRDGKVLLFIA